MSNSKTIKKAIFLLGFFILPALLCITFYYVYVRKPFVEKNSDVFKKLPFFGEKKISSIGLDTVYQSVGNFTFVNSDGEEINKNTLTGNLILLNYFYTSCRDNGPRIATHFLLLQKKIGYIKNVKFLSLTTDPSIDNVAALNNYSFKVHADKKRWQLATGNRVDLVNVAHSLSLIDSASLKNLNIEILKNSSIVVLIDKEWRIRGLYNGTSTSEANRIIDEVRLLDVEYKLRKQKKI